MKRSRRQRAASKSAFALAAKLTPEQRKCRAQRAALARYDRPAFEALKAHEAERQTSTGPKRAALQIVKQALEEHWRELSNGVEVALRAALRLGATPCPRTENRLHVYRPELVTPAIWQTLKENEREIVAVLSATRQFNDSTPVFRCVWWMGSGHLENSFSLSPTPSTKLGQLQRS